MVLYICPNVDKCKLPDKKSCLHSNPHDAVIMTSKNDDEDVLCNEYAGCCYECVECKPEWDK